jgi:hypothetical protein
MAACKDIGAEQIPASASDAECETGSSSVVGEEPDDADAGIMDGQTAVDSEAGDEPEPADAATVASVLQGRSDDCLACASGNCANYMTTCGQLTDRAAAGPAAGTRKSTLCIAALACLTESECGRRDVSTCYCGPPTVTGDMSDCIKFPDSNSGTCKSSFEAAAETTMSGALLSSLTDTSKALAWAVLLDRCLYDNKCKACFSAD